MGKINSDMKGKDGEREFAGLLRAEGLEARRGQQHAGGPDSPDVLCPSMPDTHFEVKRTEVLSLYKAMDKAILDAGDKVPVVAHRRNRKPWLVIMRFEDWLKLATEARI